MNLNLPSLRFSPRSLAVYLAITALILSIPLSIFFSNTFTRVWKVNQKIDIAEQVVIKDLIAIPEIKIDQTQLTTYTPILSLPELGVEPIIIGTISVRFYSLCILLGVIAGYIMALYLSKLNYISGNVIDRLLIGLVVFGLFGARTFFVIFNYEIFKDKPLAILTEIGQGGMALFGTIIACSIYIWLYCKRYRFNFFEFADFLAPSILIGQIIGRFGNFFNYESYGPETSVLWKMYVPETANLYGDAGSKYFHPTFLYEIIPNIFLLIFLLWTYQDSTRKNSGLVFAKYAIGYGLIRFVCEFFRLDSLKVYVPEFLRFKLDFFKFEYLMPSQIMALTLIVAGYIIWQKRHRVIYLKKDMTELFL
jgi:phosphatidylglycerol---prolipoprotein diacylglyceryl transferase